MHQCCRYNGSFGLNKIFHILGNVFFDHCFYMVRSLPNIAPFAEAIKSVDNKAFVHVGYWVLRLDFQTALAFQAWRQNLSQVWQPSISTQSLILFSLKKLGMFYQQKVILRSHGVFEVRFNFSKSVRMQFIRKFKTKGQNISLIVIQGYMTI